MNDNAGFHVRSLTPPRQFIFLGLTCLTGLLFFSAYRLFFFLSYSEQASGSSLSQILTSFVVGLRFDAVVILAILALPLLALPWLEMNRRIVRISFLTFINALCSFCMLLLLADIRVYHYFKSHLNYLSYEYLDEGDLAWNLILSDGYFFEFMLLWAFVTCGIIFLSQRLYRTVANLKIKRSLTVHILYYVLALAIAGIGIRGRLGISPLDWGAAYTGQNHFLNQLALNGIYSLGKSYAEEGHDPRLSNFDPDMRYPFVDRNTGLNSVRDMLHQPGDIWHDDSSSLMRTTSPTGIQLAFCPNLVIVVMESWAGRYTGCLGGREGLTPNFDGLAESGILFKNFFASGMRTNYGLAALLGSFPSLPGRSVMKRYKASHPFVTLSEILHRRDYFNCFLYGGEIIFDNMEGFFRNKKYDLILGEDDFDDDLSFSKWGLPDHIIFEQAAQIADSLPRPFQMTMLTLSNHEPFDLPDSSVQKFFDDSDSAKEFNSQLYADFAIGILIEQFGSKDFFDSTIFVFTSDHTRFDRGRFYIDPDYYHIPLLIYSPTLLGGNGRVVETYGGQVDLIPTLMGLLGGEYDHSSWGRNLLQVDTADGGFAMMNVREHIAYIDRDYFYYERIGFTPAFILTDSLHNGGSDVKDSKPAELNRIQSKIRQYFQIAEELSTPSVPL